jgi:ubiquinone/menaquinone biosynthesis C-methylase UbiE
MYDTSKNIGLRVMPDSMKSKFEYFEYLKHLFPYTYVSSEMNDNSKVLEIGCGEGYGSSHLSEKVHSITAVDIEKEIIDHAEGKYKSDNCHYKLYNGEKLPFEDNMFDFVISFQVIEHVPEELNFIQEAKRVLKPGGKFFITTPNKVNRLKPNEKPWNPYHLREYSAEDLKSLLKHVFPQTEMWSVNACEEIRIYELSKMKTRLQRLDIFNLRKFLPSSLKTKIRAVVTGTSQSSSEKQENFLEKYTLDDIHIEKEQPNIGLDLLGYCIKK